MPELPEVECVRRSLTRIVGRRVVQASLLRRDIATWAEDRENQSTWVGLPPKSTVIALHRHGKQLAIETRRGETLVTHLGMSGQLLLDETPVSRTHTHAQWTFDDGSTLSFRDPRRFGVLWSAPTMTVVRDKLWSRLGPDALEIIAPVILKASRESARAIKAILLDQQIVAGIGNIYADESLFAAGIRPTRLSTLTNTESHRLATAIFRTLTAAIEHGGSTLRDYVNAIGSAGVAQHTHKVYGRAGKPCVNCTRELSQTIIAQRTTVFCRRCQP